MKNEMKLIRPFTSQASGEVDIPGSKSITNRALLFAALSPGDSIIRNALFSQDTDVFQNCLNHLGRQVIGDQRDATFFVSSPPSKFNATEETLWVENAGTAARFLTAAVLYGHGTYRFDGVPAMRKRPIRDLCNALETYGAKFLFEQQDGFFPFRVNVDNAELGGPVSINSENSSQQISALAMISPMADRPSRIELLNRIVSQPYIDLTLEMMAQWGAPKFSFSDAELVVDDDQQYSAREYVVEPDASSASYFFAAAAITGGKVTCKGLSRSSLQGDIKFLEVLESMGCTVKESPAGTTVIGPDKLSGVSVNMNDISDTAPTLAAIGANASTPVTISGVEHMRWKETDRIEAMSNELRKMGAKVDTQKDGLTIYPSKLKNTEVDTYEDHRIAMSLSISGIGNEGVVIKDPGCVGKTFANFFSVLDDLRIQST